MLSELESTPDLSVLEAEFVHSSPPLSYSFRVEDLSLDSAGKVRGVILGDGTVIETASVVLTTGIFLFFISLYFVPRIQALQERFSLQLSTWAMSKRQLDGLVMQLALCAFTTFSLGITLS